MVVTWMQVPEKVVVWMAWGMIVSAFGTFIALATGLRAQYGRYTVPSTLTIPPKWDWFIQESPSLVIAVLYLLQTKDWPGFAVLTLFIIHYFQRSLIYPFLSRSARGSPWFITLCAVFFCTYNGIMQGAYHVYYAHFDKNFFTSPLTYIGAILFFVGMYTNIRSDSILRSLRQPGEVEYKVPRGFMFEYVSGANFLGEIIEWSGWAIFSRSLPAFAFALFTVCNIGPRALQHHRDYQTKFADYPKERKAVIPFIL